MGIPLSSFFNEIFLTNLETKLSSADLMPKFGMYPIFALWSRKTMSKKSYFPESLHPNIEFILEMESKDLAPPVEEELKEIRPGDL